MGWPKFIAGLYNTCVENRFLKRQAKKSASATVQSV